MNSHLKKALLLFVPLLLSDISPSYALDQIIRPYQSVRNAGMGNVRMTTGLYDENFFNNPARVTANPESKFTLLQLTPIETTSATIKHASTLASSSGDTLEKVAGITGDNLHARVQLVMPAFYLATSEERKWALAIGMIASVQGNGIIRKSYNMNFGAIVDAGPAVTFGHDFLENDALSVGITGHLTYRLATNPSYSLLDYVRGTSLTINSIGGEGAMYDFDLGSTYDVFEWQDFQFSVGAAIQNILGGFYDKISMKPANLTLPPPRQPRSYGFGISATRDELAFFENTVLAFELTDFLNNKDGSLFRQVHLGGETHWKSIAIRLGLNQGYLTAGLGLDAHYFTLDLATYGEELGLNTGTMEDRRYTLNFGFHI